MTVKKSADQDKSVGMWVTADGLIRHELFPGGRYDEARGKKASAYQGRTHIWVTERNESGRATNRAKP
jgi:hypothetical protein